LTLVVPRELPVLVTPRLVLDELAQDDRPALFGIFRDETTMRYWSGPPWVNEAPAAELLRRDREERGRGEALRWAIRLADSRALAGTATLFRFSAQNRRAETGYVLARAHWGRGLMREALAAILAHAFGPMGLERIEADTDPRNAASLALLERLGFAREGYARRRWLVAGEWCDSVLLGLLAGELRA